MYIDDNRYHFLDMIQAIPDRKNYCFAILYPFLAVTLTAAVVIPSVEYWSSPNSHDAEDNYLLDVVFGMLDLALIGFSGNAIYYSYTHFKKYPVHCNLAKFFSNKIYCSADNNIPTLVGDIEFPGGEDGLV